MTLILFNKDNELSIYLNTLKESIKKEIETYDFEKFKSYKIETLKEYLLQNNLITDIPQLNMNSLELNKERVTRDEELVDEDFNYTFKAKRTYVVINCTILYVGNDKWFQYRPHLILSSERHQIDFCKNGIIKYHFEIEINKLASQNNKDEYVRAQAYQIIKFLNEMLQATKNDIERYNNSLDSYINNQLYGKYSQEKIIFDTMGSLNIPLKEKNSSNITPIKLIPKVDKRLPLPEKDKVGELVEQYAIQDKDYININNIINMASSMMEKAAFTFGKLEEESLRDVLLVALNSHYENMVSGETFRKRGKTDILIEFENQSAYIGECKIWHGKGKISEAINQLLSYCTWRDVKCSLVFYSRNANFKGVLNTINEYLNNPNNDNIVSYKQDDNPNMWECVIKKNEDTNIMLNWSVYDLYSKDNIKGQI